MTLNTVKPRSSITRLSPSMVCGTDLLLGLVMTPSDDCVLSSIRLPFESEAQLCPAARAGRCLILGQKCVARQRRTLHPPSGGAAAPRLFDRITVADAVCAENLVRPGERCRRQGRSCSGFRRGCGWFSPRGPACCAIMIGCASATGLPQRDERVRVAAAAAGERPGQGRGDPGAAAPDHGPGAAAGHDPAMVLP